MRKYIRWTSTLTERNRIPRSLAAAPDWQIGIEGLIPIGVTIASLTKRIRATCAMEVPEPIKYRA